MKAAAIEVPVVSFAMQDREADVYAERVKYSVWETEILIRTPLGKLQARADAEMLQTDTSVWPAVRSLQASKSSPPAACGPVQLCQFDGTATADESQCGCEAMQWAMHGQPSGWPISCASMPRLQAHSKGACIHMWNHDVTLAQGHCIYAVHRLLQIITPLLGRYNVYNVLAAVAVGIALDLSLHVRSACPAHPPLFNPPDHDLNLDACQQLRQEECCLPSMPQSPCTLTADGTAFYFVSTLSRGWYGLPLHRGNNFQTQS